MTRYIRSFLLFVFVISSAGLFTACGGKNDTEVTNLVNAAKADGLKDGTSAEAAKADAKLSAAKAEIKKLAVDTARQGGFSSSANCNVLPQGMAATSAVKNFPSNAPHEYRAVCAQEVVIMNAERAGMKDKAVAAAKKAEQKKLAAAKAAEERAKRLAANSKAAKKPAANSKAHS